MGRKHNELICKLNVSLDSVLVHTFEDFTTLFSNQVIKPLANYGEKRLINSLRLMLNRSAFQFLYGGNLAFVVEVRCHNATSVFYLPKNSLQVDCEQSLFGQSRLSSAGLERAN